MNLHKSSQLEEIQGELGLSRQQSLTFWFLNVIPFKDAKWWYFYLTHRRSLELELLSRKQHKQGKQSKDHKKNNTALKKRQDIILILDKSWNKNHNLFPFLITLQNVKYTSGVCLAKDYGYSCSGLFNQPFFLSDLSINTLLQKLMESEHCAVSERDISMVAHPTDCWANKMLGLGTCSLPSSWVK